jgi:hypothetical protein
LLPNQLTNQFDKSVTAKKRTIEPKDISVNRSHSPIEGRAGSAAGQSR